MPRDRVFVYVCQWLCTMRVYVCVWRGEGAGGLDGGGGGWITGTNRRTMATRPSDSPEIGEVRHVRRASDGPGRPYAGLGVWCVAGNSAFCDLWARRHATGPMPAPRVVAWALAAWMACASRTTWAQQMTVGSLCRGGGCWARLGESCGPPLSDLCTGRLQPTSMLSSAPGGGHPARRGRRAQLRATP
jgi:hypothetical protein